MNVRTGDALLYETMLFGEHGFSIVILQPGQGQSRKQMVAQESEKDCC